MMGRIPAVARLQPGDNYLQASGLQVQGLHFQHRPEAGRYQSHGWSPQVLGRLMLLN
jgi:hypothetical protein